MERGENNDSRKYRFYRKPSIKKKGPEIKHTKTSLARIAKANPLLKYEMEELNKKINADIKPKPIIQQKGIKSKPAITKLAGNGPVLKIGASRSINPRLSSSDFNKEILSSTFNSPGHNKLIDRDNHKKVQQTDTYKGNYTKRKSISAQFLETKKREIEAISRIQKKHCRSSLRRSKSLENIRIPKKCSRIEELSECSITDDAKSVNLNKTIHIDTPRPVFTFYSDESDKENIETVDSSSYEDLLII